MQKVLLFIGLTVLLCGCGQQPSATNDLANQVQQLQAQVATLKAQSDARLSQVETNVSVLQGQIAYVWSQHQMVATNVDARLADLWWKYLDLSSEHSSVPIDLQDKGYGILKTPYGILLIGTENVEPYLDGYKIHVNIGNLTGAQFDGFSLICSTFDSTNIFETHRSTTNNMTGILIPGYWSRASFVMAPATMDEVRNAALSIELNDVVLSKVPASSQ